MCMCTEHCFAVIADEWESKIRRYAKFESVNLRSNPKRTSDSAVQQQSEGDALLATLQRTDFVVVLDERGKAITSHDMAHILATAGVVSPSVDVPHCVILGSCLALTTMSLL
jgi:23S rRNA pseudoU1915 N3-methylase RlmH